LKRAAALKLDHFEVEGLYIRPLVFEAVNMETLEVDPWITIVDLEGEPAACFILSTAMCRVVAMATCSPDK
jgi:hypothetical protein